MTSIQNVDFILLLVAVITIESPQFLQEYGLIPSQSVIHLSYKAFQLFSGNWISCKWDSYSGGKTLQPEMDSPNQ